MCALVALLLTSTRWCNTLVTGEIERKVRFREITMVCVNKYTPMYMYI